jgi:hypothetical protein
VPPSTGISFHRHHNMRFCSRWTLNCISFKLFWKPVSFFRGRAGFYPAG